MRAACVPTTPPPSTTTLAGRTPGTPPMSTPRPPVGRRKRYCRGLDRQTASDFAHRREERKASASIRHGLISDGRRAGRQEPAGLIRIGREMKIGEQNLVWLEPAVLDGLRLLDLDDQFGLREHGFRCGQNARARLLIGRVVGEDTDACAGLHDDLMPARRQLANRARHESNAELIALDLCRNADAHGNLQAESRPRLGRDCHKSRKRLLAFSSAVELL